MESFAPASQEHGQTMDRIYRHQRHVYDLTRKFCLLGRDTLIHDMDIRPGDRVLEVGCGTARNLIKLARLRDCELFGIDASEQMLKTATAKVNKRGLSSRIKLRGEYAEHLSPSTFGLDRPFDAVFFSYSLSMMLAWESAFDAALANVKPGGTVYVVDFWDQRDLPGWFQWMIRRSMASVGIEQRPEVFEYMSRLSRDGRGTFEMEGLTGRYAYLARFTRPPIAAE